MKLQKRIANSAYRSSGFIEKYQRLIKDTVIPYQYSVLNDELPNIEKSHVVQNFINAGKALRGEDIGDGFYGMVFQDSDAGKWIEATSYSLQSYPDTKLEQTVDNLIDIIADAQDNDGYLNTYFTIKDKDKRWKNLLEAHELYSSGHLIEAACAYYEATGKRKFLDVMLKNVRHIHNHFIEENHEGFPGHPEIELALMKLYNITGEKICLELCDKFINTRGVNPNFYLEEKEKRDWTVWGNDAKNGEYQQSHKPVREQTDAVGHAVRAVYLYTGMADFANETNDRELLSSCRILWESITKKRMYVTGGIGSTVAGEAFSVDYDLPSDTVYSETCASIGLMFFASRMLESDINSEYADVMERAFYNTVLSSMQLDGKRFFYVNPLEVIPGISGVTAAHHHVSPERPSWHGCACCPPNAARLISSLGQYAYGENDDTAFCHLFASGEINFGNGIKFTCETEYPFSFTVAYKIKKGGKLAIRIPSWSKSFSLTLNGEKSDAEIIKGYAYISVSDGDNVVLSLDDNPYFVYASSKVPALTGKTSLCRGPLVYCFEGVDNENDVLSISLKRNASVNVGAYNTNLLGGIAEITVDAVRRSDFSTLYSNTAPNETPFTAKAIPYFAWGNRGKNQMRVWMDELIF